MGKKIQPNPYGSGYGISDVMVTRDTTNFGFVLAAKKVWDIMKVYVTRGSIVYELIIYKEGSIVFKFQIVCYLLIF